MRQPEPPRNGRQPAEEPPRITLNEQGLPQPEPSDEVLVARVAQGEMAAFSQIYDRYARPIYVLAAYALGTTEAEEVVQEVFLRLWNKASQFDAARGTFGAWFMTIARHYLLDELKRRRQRQPSLVADEIEQVLAQVTDPKMDVEEQAWLRERGNSLRRALHTLPAEQQRVIVLAYFGGLSQSAIAKSLGWPLGTVKKRIRLGLQKLRAALLQPEVSAEIGSKRASDQ